ncbi:MAG: bifunctional metallophosphatase/5'-nucleotidase [Bacteroidaceae bacterium]|nr:bifunctional metallophosphatase/5'-nucleotidase [Bacteroidaceae bacterium]
MMKTDNRTNKRTGLGSMMALMTIIAASLTISSCKTTSKLVTQQSRNIVILYENDVHCAIDGYAHLAALRDAVADTAFVAVVSNGDFLQGASAGAISRGEYIVDIMNTVGYDAITLGNHEFDYKTPRMLQLMQRLNAPVTCVNFVDRSTRQRPFATTIVKNYGGTTIGFIGAVTPTALATEQYAFYDNAGNQLYDLCPDSIYILVQQSVDKLRKQGVDYVVLLSHLGEIDNDMHITSHTLIANTTGIDVLLDGHSHSAIPSDTVLSRDGHPVIISQTGTKFANIGKLLITPGRHLSTQLLPLATIPQTKPNVVQTTDSVKHLLEAITSRVVCESEASLSIHDPSGRQMVRYAETNAGDIVADAYRITTGAQIGMSNGGGIRTTLKAGTLTYGDLISLLPFDNNVCTVEITGSQLTELLTRCTSATPMENGDFPQVSGIEFTVHTSTHTISDLRILDPATGNYQPVRPDATYTLATIDYCISGGGFYGILKNNKILSNNIAAYCECLVKYITQHLDGHIGKEYISPAGRITITE